MAKSPINPKEKLRLKAIMAHLAKYHDNPEAMARVAKSYGKADADRLRRCRSAIASYHSKANSCMIHIGDRVVRYNPSTGEMVWMITPIEVDERKAAYLIKKKDNSRYFNMPDGTSVTAARLAHELVHGEIPNDYEVYCVNNDPSDLRIMNLRMRKMNRYYNNRLTEEERLKLRAKLAARKAEQ